MTFVFAFSCFLTAFVPASVIFLQLVSKDPLRVILFVLGAFFWLVSLLVTALLWLLFGQHVFSALIASVLLQEFARSIYYFLLHRAQTGLAKLVANGVGVSGVRFLHSSRHILAVVCGLGMGVMSALFLLLNIIADSSHDGVVGLPATIPELSNKMDIKLYYKDASFPIFYSISCSFLILNNVIWTILVWDGLHKKFNNLTVFWWPPIYFAIISHFLNTLLSFCLGGSSFLLIILHALLFTGNCTFCYKIIKNQLFASTKTP